MRNVHFSRNPKIAAFLKDYGYVMEFLESSLKSSLKIVAMIKEDPFVGQRRKEDFWAGT